MELYEEFAKVCRKWELPKDEATCQLFCCFNDIAYFEKVGQHEKSSYGFLEAAKLIRLLKNGTGIKVTSVNGGAVEVQNQLLKAALYMFLNTELQRESAGVYAYGDMAKHKEQVKEFSEYQGAVFFAEGTPFAPADLDKMEALQIERQAAASEEGRGTEADLLKLVQWAKGKQDHAEYTEPYTDEELQNIIQFEETRADFEGRLSNAANARKLGYFVQKFLIKAPEVFGYFYCHLDSEGKPLKPALTPTKQYNLIGDLLQAAGVLQHFKGQLWLEDKWAVMDNSARRKEVEGWLKSYEGMERKWEKENQPYIFLPDSNIYPAPKKEAGGSGKASPAEIEEAVNAVWFNGALKEEFLKLDI